METHALKKYLKNVMKLESELYKNEQLLNKVKHIRDVNLKEYYIGTFVPPYFRELSKPFMLEYPVKEKYKPDYSLAIAFFALSAVFMLTIPFIATFVWGVIIAGIFFILGNLFVSLAKKSVETRYQYDYNEVDKKNKKEQEYYDSIIKVRDEKVLIKKQEWEKNKEIRCLENENRRIAQSKLDPVVEELENKLAMIKNELDKYYGLEIVYSKYRNFAAISMLFEYIDSARCERLEGIDGAYNLFEMEVRQNLIITHLEKIIDQLEDIKKNQYSMYQCMRDINQHLEKMDASLSNIEKSVKEISDTTKLIAVIDYEILGCTQSIKNDIKVMNEIQTASFFLNG